VNTEEAEEDLAKAFAAYEATRDAFRLAHDAYSDAITTYLAIRRATKKGEPK